MNIIKRIRKSYLTKGLAMFTLLNMLGEIIAPTVSMALTSGPAQPEVQSFEPVETTDMVNLFTGDFTYNIPLMNVPGPNGGYPINLAYHAGVSMDQEASWTGLGWNINAGAIDRTIRGLPDDFDGDIVKTTTDIKDNYTIGLGVSTCPTPEFFGADACKGSGDLMVQLGLTFQYNNYRGFGYTLDGGLNIGNESPSYNVGLSLSNEDGIGVNASMTLSKEVGKGETNYTLGGSFNSKSGVNYIFDAAYNQKEKSHIKTTYEAFVGVRKVKTLFGGYQNEVGGLKKKYEKVIDQNRSSSAIGSSSLGYSASNHSTNISMPMNNVYLSVAIKTGFQASGVYTGPTFNGFYNTSRLENKGRTVNNGAYGYENLSGYLNQNSIVDNEIVYPVGDFSRTNDGNVMKTTSNLATPQLTHDVYQIKGQGIGGSFRANRTDVGRIHDPFTRTQTGGGSIVIKVGGGGFFKAGGSIGVTYGENKQGAWNNHNANSGLKFRTEKDLWELNNSSNLNVDERIYYKSHGESTTTSLDEMLYIGGEEPISGEIDGNGFIGNYKIQEIESLSNERNIDDRIGRNNLIHKLTNEEINSFHDNGDDLTPNYGGVNARDNYLHEYEIFYYNWGDNVYVSAPENYLSRKNYPKHNAGYKVLDQSGSYYVYGLPSYNTKTIEEVFSVNGANNYNNCDPSIPIPIVDGEVDYKIPNTHKYHSKKETPGYATSYLLTSILGADYIDVDNNGPSDSDKGYWVKMDYVRYAGGEDHYKWRAPFTDAMYMKGSVSTLEDDKATYQYGEKEVWYMNRLETKTHIAIFELSERRDNFEANTEYNNPSNPDGILGNKSGLKIDKIHLYEKKEYEEKGASATPIQTVHFVYDYSLCQGVPNNSNLPESSTHVLENQGGKLTLKELYITYEGNERGRLTPYKFNYDNNAFNDLLGENPDNPDYELNRYDRWGNYKSEGSECLKTDMPYTSQFNRGNPQNELEKENFEKESVAIAGAWTLKEISLPSGGTITVDFEADDYAYVQSEKATQMFYMSNINKTTFGDSGEDELYNDDNTPNFGEINFEDDPDQRKIYFTLENPIPTGETDQYYAEEIFNTHVRDIIKDEGGERNLYFKNYTQLKGVAWDYVSGYVPLEKDLSADYPTSSENSTLVEKFHYGVYDSNGQDYRKGYITIQCAKKKNGDCFKKYHPMALAAWQYLRTNHSELLGDAGEDFEDSDLLTKNEKAKKVKDMFGFIPEISQMFQGYRKWCYNKGMGQVIDLDRSVIRLTTPDMIKKGGGSRVKKIVLNDNWSDFESSEGDDEYGMQYEYRTIENGKEISSGVAQYEPMVGGDENALKYPKYFPGKIPFKTDNNLFFEHPINESYMPGPLVGYSKVIVSSLNTAEQIRKSEEEPTNVDFGRGVTGVKQYEFYTAKEFPVLTEQTDINKKSFNVPIVIPFIGAYRRNKLAATQGYKIELNDMHGKLKSISAYALNPMDYSVKNEPLSSTSMNYQYTTIMYKGNIVKKLNNEVKTIDANGLQENRLVGVEHEFFTDQRVTKNWSISTSLIANVDAIPLPPLPAPIAIPSVWGSIESNKNELKTFVTNKIIHKTGVLISTTSSNESYVSTAENILFDKESGRSILTKTKNEFNSTVYSYNQPAHWHYEGMGHAYKNINLEFKTDVTLTNAAHRKTLYKATVPQGALDVMEPGDEFIVRATVDNVTKNAKGTFITRNKNSATECVFYIKFPHFNKLEVPDVINDVYFKLYRSGRRNHFMQDIGNITTLNVHPINDVVGGSDLTTVSEITGGNQTVGTKKLASGVLSISAMTYRDNWESDIGYRENDGSQSVSSEVMPYGMVGSNMNENPYMTGEQGIWKPYQSFVYAGDRKQSLNSNGDKEVNLSQDGVMEDVILFDWSVPHFDKYAPTWVSSGEVVRYNEYGRVIESVDKLGIKSSALYGYNKEFVIAASVNATYHEIGAEDFERFKLNANYREASMRQEGNLTFYNYNTPNVNDTKTLMLDKFKIIDGVVNSDLKVLVEAPSNYDWSSDLQSVFFSINQFNGSRLFTRRIEDVVIDNTTYPGKTLLTISYDELGTASLNSPNTISYLEQGFASGYITIYRWKDHGADPSIDNAIEFTDEYAHTGKQCMKIEANTTPKFNHTKLELIPGKTYVMSCWIKRDNSSVPFYSDYNIYFSDLIGSNTNINENVTVSKMVEGWQKVEIELTPTSGYIVHTKFESGSSALYVDDIRISPKTGGITTYVYDPSNFRLSATLDANNYATFYYYDEKGNLHVTKRETEEGIFTISENHSHFRTN